MTSTISPLAPLEPRLRTLLPADLYALAWVDPSPATLTKVFEHLRTLRRILYDYMPRILSDELPRPGEETYGWHEGTLIFTDLAGFTPLLRVAIDGNDETVAWAWQRPDGGRSFGFSGLHFHANWRLPEYRRLVTQGVAWTAGLAVPAKGLAVEVTEDDLKLK